MMASLFSQLPGFAGIVIGNGRHTPVLDRTDEGGGWASKYRGPETLDRKRS
jgi:hypothetical protein